MLAKLREMKQDEGFTLVELLVVIAILGVLAGIVVFSVAGVQDNSQVNACKTEASTVKTAEEAYFQKNKTYGSDTNLTGQFLQSAPTLVTISAPSASGYTLTWSATCTGAGLSGTP